MSLKEDIEKLESAVREKIKVIGTNEAARELGCTNPSFISRFMNNKQTISIKKLIFMAEKLGIEC